MLDNYPTSNIMSSLNDEKQKMFSFEKFLEFHKVVATDEVFNEKNLNQ